MNIIARGSEKLFRAPKLRWVQGLQRFIKLAPHNIIIQIGNIGRGTMPRQGNLNGFLGGGIICWKPHAHNLFLNSRVLPVQVTELGNLVQDL